MKSCSEKFFNPQYLWVPLVAYYIIGFAGQLWPAFHDTSLKILNSGAMRTFEDVAFVEHLEAAFWFVGLISYAVLIRRNVSAGKQIRWCVLFGLICFAALGEETSWGQHAFGYHPHEAIASVNEQNEFNIHNLNIAKTLGVSSDHPLYKYMGVLAIYLNPVFYLLCMFIWCIFPIFLSKSNIRTRFKIFSDYPLQSMPFLRSFGMAILAYIIVDKVVFDVGELFELTMATVGAITGLSYLVRSYEYAEAQEASLVSL